MSTTDYTGRSVDLLFASGWRETGEFLLFDNISDNLRLCSGIQKLAQTVGLILLTRKGTVKGDPGFGTTFLNRVDQGVNNELQLSLLFNLAVSDLKNYLNISTTSDTPPDEKLLDASLTSIALTGSNLSLTVTVTSEAGNNREIVVPIGVAIK